MSVVPVMYEAILNHAEKSQLESLRLVVLAGDKCNSELIAMSEQQAGHILLVNEYGPTENTITTTAQVGMQADQPNIIGYPIANQSIYIINQDNNLMPVGIKGELCVSGAGLASEYWNNPELTIEKFIQNPFVPGERMYRTGDIAKRLPDGNVEFLGRADYQVKIRGYRIELVEVERAIMNTNLLREAIVMEREDLAGKQYLCAYILASEPIDLDVLNELLLQKLPNYMIPTRYIQLDSLPLTPNGKIHRKALPDPYMLPGQSAEYVQPTHYIEHEIVAIWANVLGIDQDKIGINNSFFHLGGNSLLLMQVHHAIDRLYPDTVSIPELFVYHTVSKLALFIEDKQSQNTGQFMLDGVKLPEDYFHVEPIGRLNDRIYFEVPADVFCKIKHIEHATPENILIFAYAYLLMKLSDTSTVCLQAITGSKNVIRKVTLDFREQNDFTTLFSMMDRQIAADESAGLRVSKLARSKVVQQVYTVLPLFYTKHSVNRSNTLHEFFDLLLELNLLDDSAQFACEYNSALLKDDKAEEIVHMYLKLLELMAAQFS